MSSHERTIRADAAGSHLSAQVSHRLGAPLIYVEGELDHDTASYLRETIEKELAADTKALVLDFSELAYMDSGGLALMFETARKLKGSGWLVVVGANAGVCRLLQLTGLADHSEFRLLPDLRAASSALDSLNAT